MQRQGCSQYLKFLLEQEALDESFIAPKAHIELDNTLQPQQWLCQAKELLADVKQNARDVVGKIQETNAQQVMLLAPITKIRNQLRLENFKQTLNEAFKSPCLQLNRLQEQICPVAKPQPSATTDYDQTQFDHNRQKFAQKIKQLEEFIQLFERSEQQPTCYQSEFL